MLFLVILYAYANCPKPNGNVATTHNPLKAWNFYTDENKKWEWVSVKTTDILNKMTVNKPCVNSRRAFVLLHV
jgi:hypothetical protein